MLLRIMKASTLDDMAGLLQACFRSCMGAVQHEVPGQCDGNVYVHMCVYVYICMYNDGIDTYIYIYIYI